MLMNVRNHVITVDDFPVNKESQEILSCLGEDVGKITGQFSVGPL